MEKGGPIMDEYTTLRTNEEDYDRLVLCLSSESLLAYIEKIEQTLAEDNLDGKVLVDQLLLTGNGTNRFISVFFSHGKFDLRTAQTVNPTDHYRKATVEWLHDNYHYAENSILTADQKQKIKDNIVF